MRKLIISTIGVMDWCADVEELLAFYPDGLKGLIAAYLDHYLDDRESIWIETDRDVAFFDNVLELYQASPEYRAQSFEQGNRQDLVITLTCYHLASATRELVQTHQREIRHSTLNPTQITLGEGYVALPMYT